MAAQTTWFAIRADANTQIGLGHIMRCLALAEWAADQGIACIVLTRSGLSPIQSLLDKLAVEVQVLESAVTGGGLVSGVEGQNHQPYAHSHWLAVGELQDAADSCQCLSQLSSLREQNPLFVVVDHYALGAPWETCVANIAPILAIDDLHDRPHRCNWLLDQTHGRAVLDYAGLVNDDCHLFLGARYGLLRKEFSVAKKNVHRRGINTSAKTKAKLLLNLGGSDEKNATAKILTILNGTTAAENWLVTVLGGASNPHIHALTQLLPGLSFEVALIEQSDDMVSLMSAHDVCIGAAGSSAWERCALGLPTLLVVLAENQQDIAKNIHAAGAGINIGHIDRLTTEQLDTQLKRMYEDAAAYMNVVSNAAKLCDGMGCLRVLDTLLEL